MVNLLLEFGIWKITSQTANRGEECVSWDNQNVQRTGHQEGRFTSCRGNITSVTCSVARCNANSVGRRMDGMHCIIFKISLTTDVNPKKEGGGKGLVSHWLILWVFKSRIKHPLPYKHASLSWRMLSPRFFTKRLGFRNCVGSLWSGDADFNVSSW